MTLFKKVFQTQSNPVDPGADAAEVEAMEQRAREALLSEVHETDETEYYAEDVSEGFEEEEPSDAEALEEPDFSSVLERARAGLEAEEPSQPPEQDSLSIEQEEALARILDEAPETDAPKEEIEDWFKDAKPADAREPKIAPEVDEQEPPAAVTPDETLDVVAFAREQMRAAGLPAPAAAPAEEAAPKLEQPAPALDLSQPQAETATPAAGRAGRRAGRVKTRLLGFNRGEPETTDPFDSTQVETAIQGRGKFPVGWLVVVDGPGTGHSFALFSGASMIGRGEDQVIKLDFGDNSISRQNHAAVAYDDEQNKFYLGHGGKSNIIRLNARPVLSTEELTHSDLIRIGETTLRFVALCGKDFQWNQMDSDDAAAI